MPARTALVMAALALLGPVVPAGASPARLRSCAVQVDFNLRVSSARDMRCRTAGRDLRRYKGSIAAHFRTPGGFRCRRVSGSALAGQWRCVKGHKAYRFEFSD